MALWDCSEPGHFCTPEQLQQHGRGRRRQSTSGGPVGGTSKTTTWGPQQASRHVQAFGEEAPQPSYSLTAASMAAAADSLGTAAEALGATAEQLGAPSPRFNANHTRRPAPFAPPAPPEVEPPATAAATAEARVLEVQILQAQVEEQRQRAFESQQRVASLLDLLRDEQERADDFRAQLEMRKIDVQCVDKRISHRQQTRIANQGSTRFEFQSEGDTQNEVRSPGLHDEEVWWSSQGTLAAGGASLDAPGSHISRKSRQSAVGAGRQSSLKRQVLESGGTFSNLEKKFAMDDTTLIDCFRGSLRALPDMAVGDSKDLPVPGGAPRGEGMDLQYSWILALSLPNPRAPGNASLRTSGISEEEAASIYDACFKSEDFGGDGAERVERLNEEKNLFIEAFLELPDAVGHAPQKRYSGVEPTESSFRLNLKSEFASDGFGGEGGSMDPEKVAQSFLELLRNAIVTKITMHCQLAVRTCATEDESSVLVLVTATAKDLLREADKLNFPTELDVRAVDPASIEPCCPKSYYPLLEWYLRKCPGAPIPRVCEAYKKVVHSILQAPSKELKKRANEVCFWANYELCVVLDDVESPGGFAKLRREMEQEGVMMDEPSMAPVSSKQDAKKSVRAAATNVHMGHEKDNLYASARMRELCLEAFVRYLELKAERGLAASPVELIAEVNAEVGKQVLMNWHTAIGLPSVAEPYKAFRLDQYESTQARTWEWKAYACRARRADATIWTPFNGNERAKLCESIIMRQLDLAQLSSQGFLTSTFPLDARDKIERTDAGHVGEPSVLSLRWGLPETAHALRKCAAFIEGIFRSVPLDEAKDYYGERIAFYFALVDTVCWCLFIPGFIGIVTFIIHLNWSYDPRTETAPPLCVVVDVFYATMIAVWGTVVQERWKRRQTTLAFQWGQRGISQVEEPRPRFRGKMRRNPVSYEDGEMYYTPRQRAKWQLLSMVVLGTLGMLEFVCTVLIGRMRGTWVAEQWRHYDRAQQATAFMEDIQMTLCSKLGNFLSFKLNEWENHRTGTQYINGLISKVVSHELWNRFHLYFYVAFVKSSREGCVMTDLATGKSVLISPEDMNSRMCYQEVATQVTTVLCVEFAKNAMELIQPLASTYIKSWLRPTPDVIAVDEGRGVARMAHFCQEAMEKPQYGDSLEVDGTFGDYLEIMVLLGHFTLFPLVFPLAPTMGVVLMMVELRVDGFKLFELVRRPLPRNAEDIGYWLHVIGFISWTSMFTNAGLVVFTLGSFDQYFGTLPRWVYFAFFAGVLCLFKVLVQALVPDVPEMISIAEDHHTFIRQKMDQSYGQGANRKKEEVHLSALDLSIDNASSGQWRDPAEFGITQARLARRVAGLKRRQSSKKGTVAATATFVSGTAGGAALAEGAL